MRDLRKHSAADNLEYLKENDKKLYRSLIYLTKYSFKQYQKDKDRIDSDKKFFDYLERHKSVMAGATINTFFQNSPVFQERSDLLPLVDIFEWLFRSAIEESEYQDLDPDIHELYLKAQKMIDEEQNNE